MTTWLPGWLRWFLLDFRRSCSRKLKKVRPTPRYIILYEEVFLCVRNCISSQPGPTPSNDCSVSFNLFRIYTDSAYFCLSLENGGDAPTYCLVLNGIVWYCMVSYGIASMRTFYHHQHFPTEWIRKWFPVGWLVSQSLNLAVVPLPRIMGPFGPLPKNA